MGLPNGLGRGAELESMGVLIEVEEAMDIFDEDCL
jgi:hypothetical protein